MCHSRSHNILTMVTAKDIFVKLQEKIFKKKKAEDETALERMNGIMNFINFFAQIAGLQFTDDWDRSVKILIAAFMDLALFACTTYTVYTIFPSTDNIIMLSGFAIVITVAAKLFLVTVNHENFVTLLRFIFKVLKINTTGQRQRILVNMSNDIHYHLKVNISGFLAGYTFFAFTPLYHCIVNGELAPLSPMLVPFINPNNLRGYFITTGFNFVVLLYLSPVNVATNSLFFVFVDAYAGLVSLIEHDIRAFDVMCGKKESRKMCDEPFRNLMMELMDLARFNTHVNGLYNVISTVHVAMSYSVVVCCLGGYFAFDYVGGIGAALFLFTEILMYCYIGQLLDNSNQRIVTVICNAKWYTYKVKHQKDMMMALYIAQNMQPIWLANMYPLNFDTGLQVTNSIYTLIMFMLEMVD